MVLQQPSPPPTDNVRLTTAILDLTQRSAAQGLHVRFNWVARHVGLRGNEAADEAARAVTRWPGPAVPAAVLPSLQQAKTLARRAAANSIEQQHREMEASSRQAAWAGEVLLHRLRLGYRTLEELRDDFESGHCGHCGHLARHPLRHCLLSCPATAQLRQQIGGPEYDEDRAALVFRRAQEDLPRLLAVLLPPAERTTATQRNMERGDAPRSQEVTCDSSGGMLPGRLL
ncbi:hypothetical protein GWK47_011939 [Chionoecetes opilio]|uniref:RNase H type-1 domain-containing protein n=1 Tax=Chionoecetes opilio TaxID=41210 RepID=A0A8J4XWC3_CHIOP|nr:hypothetical protein GWK47_011939 [Chionoecetes opilio]